MLTNRNLNLFLLFLAGTTAAPAQAGFYDAASNFSATANPNGVWSYGYSTSLGSTFTLYTNHGIYQNPNGIPNGLDAWNDPISLDNPAVVHNGTANTITYNGTATYVPGQLGIHPGPDGEYSIVRFTAPTTTIYSLSSAFSGLDFVGPTTTDVHVLLDSVSIFNGIVNAYGAGPIFSQSLSLKAGDTVGFEVGYGSNNNFLYDSTGLSASFSSSNVVPEPSSIVLSLISISYGTLLYCVRRRKHR